MSMKKKVLFLLIPLLITGLSGCVKYNGQGKPGTNKSAATPATSSVAPEPSSSLEPVVPPAPHDAGEQGEVVPPATQVTVYLVFGENGLYHGNKVTDNNPDLFLEHVVPHTALSGTDLPGASEVTSSVEGSKFVAWTAYNNDGKLTEYTQVPNVNGKILYASFSGGQGGSHSGGGDSGGGSSGGETPQPSEYPGSQMGDYPAEGYGLLFSDGSFMEAHYTDEFEGFKQYVIEKRSFKQGQVFAMIDFANINGPWIKPINEHSFNKNVNQYIAVDETNQKYVALKDFNVDSVYIKLKYGLDEIYFGLAA